MLPVERHQTITDAVKSAQVVSTDALVQLLGVSPETVRRDLAALEQRGALRRVHGGATSVLDEGRGEASYTDRAVLEHEAKARLAQVAVGLLEDGQTVVIDIGTTAVEVARAVPRTFRGTIATPSLQVAAELADRPGVEVLVSGGRVRRGDLACSNTHAQALFAHLYPDLALLGSGGIDAKIGLTDFHYDEIASRRTVIANSARSYALADASKIGRVAPFHVCGLDALDGLITNAPVPPAMATAVEEAGGVVLHP